MNERQLRIAQATDWIQADRKARLQEVISPLPLIGLMSVHIYINNNNQITY